jgi:cell division protein FtsW (lipid II flippase)
MIPSTRPIIAEGWKRIPLSVPLIVGVLLAAGWLGIARSDELTDGTGAMLRHQMVWSGLGVLAMLLAGLSNYRLLRRYSYAAFACVVLLLLAVYLFAPINGAHRWIRFERIGFQPSEFAKLAFVLALARYLTDRDSSRQWWGLLVPLLLAVLPAWLVLKEPDLGTALVFVPVLFAMLLAAGARLRHLAGLALLGVALLPALWMLMSSDQRLRVTALWEQNTPDASPTPAGFHLHQAKRMFALGGLWGNSWTPELVADRDALVEQAGAQLPELPSETVGVLMNSSAATMHAAGFEAALAARHVPEPYTDSIFCVLGERFGIAGAAMLLAVYALLIWRTLAIAERTSDPFGRLLAVGVTVMIGIQVIINAGMLVGLLPITGVPLPLVSYGGSGLLANTFALGLVASVGAR